MAYLPPKELDLMIKQLGFPEKKLWTGAQTKSGLESALKEIREKQFVSLVSIHHSVGFAVPIYLEKKVTAALGVFVPESRYSDSQKDKIIKLMRQATKKMTEQLEA